jgi:ABC-type Zn uptake system ZnuABC Zn-binding protein ZnuA
VYFARRYGIDLVGTIEVKPGIPATPGHLEELLALMQREKVDLIIREVSYDPGLAGSLADRTGARLANFAVLAGGLGQEGYIASIQANIESLLHALPAGSEQ